MLLGPRRAGPALREGRRRRGGPIKVPVQAPGPGEPRGGPFARARLEGIVSAGAAAHNGVQVQRQAHRVRVLRQQACILALGFRSSRRMPNPEILKF